MAKKKAVRRENGRGTVEFRKGQKNPYKAKVPVGTKLDKEGKVQAVYKSIGSFPTRKEAETALSNYSQNPFELSNEIKTYEDLYNVWSEDYFKRVKPSSSRTVKCAYEYCGSLYKKGIRDITIGDIKDAMNKGYIISTRGADKGQKRYASDETKARIKSLCNLMFDYALERKLVLFNPARAFKLSDTSKTKKKKSKGKIPFTIEQVAELWEYVDDIRWVDMVLIGIYTGFRPQELSILETANVHLNEDKIIGGMKTENGEEREVPIHPEIKALVEKRYNQAVNKYHSDRLFNDPESQTGMKLTYDKYRGRFKNVMSEMGFKGLTPHCTRHTFSTQAKRCKMDAGILKRIVGHSLDGDITESVYVHPTFADLTNEMRKVDFTKEVYG